MAGTLHEDRYAVFIISRSVVLRMRNISDKRHRENQNTHFILKNTPPPGKSCHLWHNVEKLCRAEAIDYSTAHAHRWIRKATNTHSDYVTHIAFLLLQWLDDVPQCCAVCTLPVLFFIVNRNSGIENSGENWGFYGDASCYVKEGKTPEWARKVKSGACVCHWGNADRHQWRT